MTAVNGPDPRGDARQPNLTEADLRRADLEEKQRNQRHPRVVLDRLEKRDPMTKRSERQRMAENMWRILERAQHAASNVTKAKVLQKAGFGSKHDSSKRLPQFALNPALPEADRQRRSAKLTQDARKYLRIARTAAQESGAPEDAFVPDLVDGTRFGERAPDHGQSADEEVAVALKEWVTIIVRDIAPKLSERHDLGGCFRSMAARWIDYEGRLLPDGFEASPPPLLRIRSPPAPDVLRPAWPCPGGKADVLHRADQAMDVVRRGR